MCKKILEHQDCEFGKTEWWSLHGDHEITVDMQHNIMIIGTKAPHASQDLTKKVFYLLINSASAYKDDFKLEEFPLGGSGIHFPPEKKISTLKLINEIFVQNDTL
jgi:hypothetical protein